MVQFYCRDVAIPLTQSMMQQKAASHWVWNSYMSLCLASSFCIKTR